MAAIAAILGTAVKAGDRLIMPSDMDYTVSEGFIHLSVGCEDMEDLLADLSQALDKLSK